MKQHCSSGGRNGHLASNCFHTLGYPEWWGELQRGKQSSGPQPGRGSGSQKERSSARANAVSIGGLVHQEISAHAVTASDRAGLTGLTDEKWKSLVTLRNECKQHAQKLTGMSFLSSWIIDSGAKNHMTGTLGFISDIREVIPLQVKFLMGELHLLHSKELLF